MRKQLSAQLLQEIPRERLFRWTRFVVSNNIFGTFGGFALILILAVFQKDQSPAPLQNEHMQIH